MQLLKLFLLSLVMLQLKANGLAAAEIVSLSDRPRTYADIWSGKCTHSLVGEVVEGDAERFRSAIDALGGQDHDDLNFLLCLDSPGGSLSEGLKIGQLIKDNYFATYVPESAECLSACAIAFMHGRVAYWESVVNHRMIHPTARLGFHAPRLVLPEIGGPIPAELIDASYASAVSIIADLSRAASFPVNQSEIATIPLSLLAEMLDTPPNSFVYVDHLYQAFAWDIEVYPHDLMAPDEFDLEVAYYQLCRNTDYELQAEGSDWYYKDGNKLMGGFVISALDVAQLSPNEQRARPEIPEGAIYVEFDGMAVWGCSLLYMSEFEQFDVKTFLEGEFESEIFLPAVYLFPPDLPIRDLWP